MPTSGVPKYMSIINFSTLRPDNLRADLLKSDYASKRQFLISLCAALGFCLVYSEQAKADFVGYYALSNFTLTNTDDGGYPSYTNGSAVTPDDGQSVVLTSGNSGSGLYGATDLFIVAAASGTVEFDWSYSSTDPSSSGKSPYGCGLGFAQSCDDGGYLLGGSVVNGVLQNATYVELGSDTSQGSGFATFSVTAGEIFGFEVETMDNTGGGGVLTISDFSAPCPVTDPVPEPRTASTLLGLIATLMATRQAMVVSKRKKENAA